MSVHYEWDVEQVRTYPDDNGEDIIEHWFQNSYAGCVKQLKEPLEAADESYRIVLVCDDDKGRSWAYLDIDDKLPEYFEDAWCINTRKVPQRFHKEVAKLTESTK